MRNDPSETTHVIDPLKEEIRQLSEKQSQAVEALNTSASRVKRKKKKKIRKKKYDERLEHIGNLQERAVDIENSKQGTVSHCMEVEMTRKLPQQNWRAKERNRNERTQTGRRWRYLAHPVFALRVIL
jgi:hypothetical protein